jgi:hypothetical protein
MAGDRRWSHTAERLETIECATCGARVAYAGTGRPPRYCSASCRRRGWDLHRAEQTLQAGDPRPTVVRETVARERVEVRRVPGRPPEGGQAWADHLPTLTRQLHDPDSPTTTETGEHQRLARALLDALDALDAAHPGGLAWPALGTAHPGIAGRLHHAEHPTGPRDIRRGGPQGQAPATSQWAAWLAGLTRQIYAPEEEPGADARAGELGSGLLAALHALLSTHPQALAWPALAEFFEHALEAHPQDPELPGGPEQAPAASPPLSRQQRRARERAETKTRKRG